MIGERKIYCKWESLKLSGILLLDGTENLFFKKYAMVRLHVFKPFSACLSLVFEISTYSLNLKIWFLTYPLYKGISPTLYS